MAENLGYNLAVPMEYQMVESLEMRKAAEMGTSTAAEMAVQLVELKDNHSAAKTALHWAV